MESEGEADKLVGYYYSKKLGIIRVRIDILENKQVCYLYSIFIAGTISDKLLIQNHDHLSDYIASELKRELNFSSEQPINIKSLLKIIALDKNRIPIMINPINISNGKLYKIM